MHLRDHFVPNQGACCQLESLLHIFFLSERFQLVGTETLRAAWLINRCSEGRRGMHGSGGNLIRCVPWSFAQYSARRAGVVRQATVVSAQSESFNTACSHHEGHAGLLMLHP